MEYGGEYELGAVRDGNCDPAGEGFAGTAYLRHRERKIDCSGLIMFLVRRFLTMMRMMKFYGWIRGRRFCGMMFQT